MIPQVAIRNFIDDVSALVPSASEPDIEAALRDAADEMCRKTKMWRVMHDFTINTPANQIIAIDTESVIEVIEAARLNGRELALVDPDYLDEKHPGWNDATPVIAPARYLTQTAPGYITVYPSETGTLRARIRMLPQRDCTTLPKFLFDYHLQTLAIGAAARLFMSVSKNYSNPNYGAELSRQFLDKINTLATSSSRHQIHVPRRSRSIFF